MPEIFPFQIISLKIEMAALIHFTSFYTADSILNRLQQQKKIPTFFFVSLFSKRVPLILGLKGFQTCALQPPWQGPGSISGISFPPGTACLPGDGFRCHTNHVVVWKVFIVSFKPTPLPWEAQQGCALHCKTPPGCHGLIHKTWAGLRTSSSWGTLIKICKD